MQQNGLGIVLVGHGSRIATANQAVEKIKNSMVQVTGLRVESAFLQLAKPTVAEAAAMLIKEGCKKLILLPYFLYKGQHVSSDLPQIVATLNQKWPFVEFQLAPPVGEDSRLVHILIDKVMSHSQLNGQEIEALSLSLVAELAALPASQPQQQVAARVVHATGDILLANQLLFAANFFTKALAYLTKDNFVIVTDVKMTAAAISTSLLPSAAKVVCALEYQAKFGGKAQTLGSTRSQQAIRKTLTDFPEAAVVIGNAPTALEEVLEMLAADLIAPPFIVGVPVGFVGAHQAKERLSQSKAAYATLLGTRGGSAVAGAIINALLKLAKESSEHEKKS